jgi:hypothetical protein
MNYIVRAIKTVDGVQKILNVARHHEHPTEDILTEFASSSGADFSDVCRAEEDD